MSKTLLLLAAFVCVANCLVQSGALKGPARQAPISRAVAPSMMVEETSTAVSTLASIGTAVAASAGDFGGYTIPIIGISLLVAIIGILAGPVEE